jgi:hypothetical protein
MITDARGNITYTPELIDELKRLTQNLPRAEGVRAVGKRLKKSERQSRDIYARYIAGNVVPKETLAVQLAAKPTSPKRLIRRLFWDIETSPNVGLFWKAGWKLNIDCENIIKERAIICIGWKFEGDKEAKTLQWDQNQCDKTMLAEFLKVANEADEIIHHNGDRFDMPWFKTRCLFHGLVPLPDYKCSDTLQWARRKFYFNSNKLNYIAKFLGLGGKIKTEFGLWKEIVLNKCPKAMKSMTTYCKRDVILLEEVWKRLSKLVPAKTHVGVLMGSEKWTSPKDGNTNVILEKRKVTANGTIQYQFRDKLNGGYYTIGQAAYNAYIEAKKS